MTDEFPGNSQSSRPSERPKTTIDSDDQPKRAKPTTPVVTGVVTRKKKGFGEKLKETFIGGGEGESVFGYLVKEVVVPAIQDLAVDFVKKGIDKAVFGDDRGSSSRSSRSTVSSPRTTHVSYDRPGASSRSSSSRRASSRRSSTDIGIIILERKVEAEMVLDRMQEIIDDYNEVTVADLYDALNQSSNYTDNKFGWDNLDGADIRRVREGWQLILEEPEALR